MHTRLLGLAQDAVQRGWWDDYADILSPEYLEFIGLEDEAASCSHWQADGVPGLWAPSSAASAMASSIARPTAEMCRDRQASVPACETSVRTPSSRQ